MVERIRNTIVTFTRVTTLVVFATAIYITIFEEKNVTLGVEILWQILATSFLASCCMICCPTKEMSKKKFIIINIVYYIYVNIVVLGSGILYEWFAPENVASVIGMLILIFVIFILVTVSSLAKDIPMVKALNEKLGERNKEED